MSAASEIELMAERAHTGGRHEKAALHKNPREFSGAKKIFGAAGSGIKWRMSCKTEKYYPFKCVLPVSRL